ncbi:ciliogenesis and planar polarity effector 1 [Rhinichthys klamathensis goyatoka]|uniref:ciliogenesis and planar polarity effector 1 n=1 Tax=Rhinichthys klamathensis goyatoka TaxID=3034132 RepID=UPI0024B50ABB|nr:ciliogenesis and planar polarity effector 1 [Rhinichthys klamathensis goyatoka]
MDVKFEVLLSSSIKRRKPWPRFCWLGREKEGVFLLDDSRISEVHLLSGRTKKKIPKLQPLLQRVVSMSASQNGVWLVGLLVSGELFLWNKDKDLLKTVSAVPAVHQLVSSIKGPATTLGLSLLVSENAQRVFLAALTGQVFLWECTTPQDLSGPRDATITGRWSHISCHENTQLPSVKDKEASVHSVFVKNQAVGDACLSAFVFTADGTLTVTLLKIQWDSTWENKLSSAGFSVHWSSKCFPFNQLLPPCKQVKSRGSLVPAFSPDAQLLAVVLNQKDPRATQVLFISTQNFVTVSSLLGGCGVKTLIIPAKYVRSYWVCSVSWTPEGLYLACVLKRGSLLMLARLGGLVSLSTTGCSVEFGAAHFLPLHPLVTYRAPVPLQTQDGGLSSSSVSLRDPMRQRFSVTCHPRQPLLIVSDGYMITVLRMSKRPSAVGIMSALLLDAARGLENIREVLGSSQPQVRSRLESMSTLTFTGSLLALKEKEIPLSTLPLYLQGTGDLTQCTETAQDEEDHDSDEDPYACSHMQDGGKLEFASMFDTLHAQAQADPESTSSDLPEDLNRVHKNLLRAWALAVSLGGSMEQRERLLKYTILCVVRLVKLLRVSDSKSASTWLTHALHTLRALLSFLPWDATHSSGRGCLGVTVELTRCFVDLFVPLSSSGVALSSQNFSAALFVLQQASRSVDRAYSLPSRALHHGEDGQRTYSSDMFSVPILQEDTETVTQTARQQPSNRLVVIWRELYRLALRYQEELRHQRGQGVVKHELEKMSVIIAQVQQALQSAGDRLEESHTLRSFTGEQHFILGEYAESVQIWRAELWAEREKAGPMTCYLETRHCLALLYAQLFQYRLREAQGLCDRLAHQLQSRAGREEEDMPGGADESVCECWLSGPVGREAACAVVQSLGRFMAAYFTNRPLCILPPHNVDLLPPLHLPNNTGVRVVELSQARAAVAVRFDQLSEVWTVDYALELLLLGGLIPEAVWMAQHLGDWKMAATLGLAYTNYCSGHLDFSSLQWRELHLPTELKPAGIFHDQLEKLLGRMLGSEGDDNKDAVSVEDVDLLQVSVQEILRASVMAEVNVVSQPLTRLMNAAKERATSLPALVPPAFYLPAPPLYCPQPSPNTQDSVRDPALVLETETRCGISGLVQKVLMIFRAAHGSLPAAQWYISSLHRCRHLLNKIQKKVSEPKAELIPDGLKKFFTHRGFFQSGPSKDMDGVTTHMITCFRELCALCWMLHVRDQLTITCRRYQTARKREKDTQVSDLSVSDVCVEALCWARRLLPFCRFMNAEEALQDLVLSLVSELPPSHVTAETLARVFPDESESVRVPLREKYTSLVQRLRPVVVPDTSTTDVPPGTEREDEGDTVMILIQDQLRQRRRELRRLEKYLGAAEPYLWEREEEEDRGAAVSILRRLSLGTSLSDSTLTDGGRPLVYSEGDTAETLSETLPPEPQTQSAHSSKTAKFHDAPEKSKQDRKGNVEPKEPESSRVGSSAPTVGTWEFELEDDEYMLFLDLFLSYVLGKDRLDAEESELPLLSSFSQRFHARELHSVTFDMLTSLKRRQKDGRKRGARLPLFRAGHCFQSLPVSPEASPVQDTHDTTSPWTLPGIQAGRHQGLFSRRRHHTSISKVNRTGSDVGSTGFRILSPDELGVQMQLDSSMEIRFPRLARLLEWMMRWADRRVLLSQPMGKRSEGSDAVVIRVKGSTPAVLCALELLEERYSAALLGEDTHHSHYKLLHQRAGPEAPVLQPITGWGRDQDSSVDTPITLHRHSHAVRDPEDVVDQTDDQLSEHEDTMTSDLQNNVTEIRQTTEAEDVDSSADDVTEASWANQSRDQTITLADLECPDIHEHSLHSQPEVSASVSVQHVNGPTDTHIRGHPPHSEAQTPPDPVRQLIHDELFRLVQLQQINFMSLMQVVGASFVNLPLSQPSMHQSNVNVPQTTAIPAQHPPQPQPISLTHNAQHTTCDDTNLPTRATRPERVNNDEHPVNVNSGLPLNPNITLKTQEIHQLTIRSDWPENGQSPGQSFIPPSHGLLTTANTHSAFNGVSEAPKPHGLRLLQLNPSQRSPPPPLPPPLPPVKDSWGPDPPSVPRVEDRNRTRAESHRYNTHTQESLRPHRSVALPLLRFHPETQRTVTLPRIPQCTLAKPSLGVTATGRYPRIQLLHREPDPPAADVRLDSAPVRTPRLIPLEELLKWTNAKHTQLQLLNTHTVPENKPTTTSPSNKRRKRREEKNKEDRIGVTFRPEDSIIPPDEPAEDVPDHSDALTIPLGVECELSGLALLDQAYVTSAELHAFASTQKRPPEIQDACTNTDNELPRCITDPDVSVQTQSPPSMPSAPEGGLLDVAPVVPPDVFLNLRFSKDNSSDQPETTSLAESSADLNPEGRRFINVIDLTDDSLLQSLPSFPPSSAELHLLAASVINPASSVANHAPKPALNSAPNNTEHFTETPIGEIPGVCVSPEAVLGGDPVTLSELKAVNMPGLERALMSRSQISARLSEMDSQLLRLQSIADHMDREFANTRLLVNRVETQSPSVKKPLSSALRVTREVRSYCPSPQRFDPDREDEEFLSSSVSSRCSVHQERSPPEVKPEQRKRDTDLGLPESPLEDAGNGEETLGVSGLSDVKDILSELIRDGALSRSALDLSRPAAPHRSRSEVSASGAMMEEERRDLRMWMRRKQRERLMEYRKQREEKRESERRPFVSPLTHNPTSVDLATNKKSKEERDRTVLQEHHEQRARDACSLITDLLTTPLNLPTIPHDTLRSRSQASGKNKRVPKNQSGPHRRSASSLGKTVVLQGKSAGKAHGSLNQRLGLHRPASDLPGDRLSQVTRRGMLSDLRPRQGTKSAHQSMPIRMRFIDKSYMQIYNIPSYILICSSVVMKNGFHTPTAKPRVVKERDRTHVEERDAESPDEHRIPLLEDHDIRQADESFINADHLRDLDLDSFSQSTGSVLSKLDWAAIERIVAEDEQN